MKSESVILIDLEHAFGFSLPTLKYMTLALGLEPRLSQGFSGAGTLSARQRAAHLVRNTLRREVRSCSSPTHCQLTDGLGSVAQYVSVSLFHVPSGVWIGLEGYIFPVQTFYFYLPKSCKLSPLLLPLRSFSALGFAGGERDLFFLHPANK